MLASGYAVVDVETTGLSPGKHDRIAEVAVVQLNRDGGITGEWCTLVNPERDLGPQHIHGIRASEVREAPKFADIAGDLAVRLAGRVVVAHNLTFDVRFLTAEYRRIGVEIPVASERGLCTMRLSSDYLSTARRSLASCCESAGVEHSDAHSALHDARACAKLFTYFIRATPRPEPWADLLAMTRGLIWPVLPCGIRRAVSPGAAGARDKSFLARMIDRLPRADQPRADEYLALLDRALLDRFLSVSEQDALLELAGELRLTLADTMELHRAYLLSLAEAAWQDAVVTDAERADLHEVAELLGLSRQEADIALETAKDRRGSAQPRRFRLAPGDLVAFTGQLSSPREHWEARAIQLGLRVKTVTRQTRLLVAADPDSLSGKAGTARKYGVPIVTEDAFGRLLDQMA